MLFFKGSNNGLKKIVEKIPHLFFEFQEQRLNMSLHVERMCFFNKILGELKKINFELRKI